VPRIKVGMTFRDGMLLETNFGASLLMEGGEEVRLHEIWIKLSCMLLLSMRNVAC